MSKTAKHRNENWLREQYEDKSIAEVAALAGVADSTIIRNMKRLGIERRTPGKTRRGIGVPAPFRTSRDGYEYWYGGNNAYVSVHQLLAIANGDDPYAVFDPDTDVHHDSEIPWDNRPENVQTLSHGEHTALHNRGNGKLSPLDKIRIAELWRNGDCKQEVIAGQFGVAQSAISRAVNEVRA